MEAKSKRLDETLKWMIGCLVLLFSMLFPRLVLAYIMERSSLKFLHQSSSERLEG